MSVSLRYLLLALSAASVLGGSIAHADGLAAQVAAKLKASGTMSGYRVSVKSQEKTVFLEGAVGSARQIEAAISAAENTPGVERVVNRLSVRSGQERGGTTSTSRSSLSLPASVTSIFGAPSAEAGDREAAAAAEEREAVRLAQATEPTAESGEEPSEQVIEEPIEAPAKRPMPPSNRMTPAKKPRPLGTPLARPMAGPNGSRARGNMPRNIARTGGIAQHGDPMVISDVAVGEGGMSAPHGMQQGIGPGETIVPGSERMVGGGGMPGGGYAGGTGRPLPMGAGGPGGPVAGQGPNMPGYAWPSYAAYPNYAAVQYPTQYSPTAWPYIGPFYPYPQVPLGWRRVSLEWDDGWWFLDFDDDHLCRGHH